MNKLTKKYRNKIFNIFEETEIFKNIKLNFPKIIKEKMINKINLELENFYNEIIFNNKKGEKNDY